MDKRKLIRALEIEAEHAGDLERIITNVVDVLERLPDWLVGDGPDSIDIRIPAIRRAISNRIAAGDFDERLAVEAEVAFIELERFV